MDFDFTSYLWIKFWVIIVAAGIWGLYEGLSGR